MEPTISEIKPAGLLAIMGGTGAGKSTFINAIFGGDVADVGHSLNSQTSEIKEYDLLTPNGLHVTLVDMPGFNDYSTESGSKPNLVILKEIGAFLKDKYDENRKLSGILYLHNISDPNVDGSLQRNMTMFKKLCGSGPLKNVVVVTTFWDEIDMTQGIQYETELKNKDKFFKCLVDGKSKFVRSGIYPPGKLPEGPKFPPPISIVCDLIALDPVFVRMQKELATGKTVEETSAGVELYKELQELKRQQERDIINLNQKIAEMKAINIRDRVAREALEDESEAMKAQIKEWKAKQHELKLAVRPGRSEWIIAMGQLIQEAETSAKHDDLELEAIYRAELRSEIELLKTRHAKENLECQFQIRSLLDDKSMDAFRRTQLEKECKDFKATASDLKRSLTSLRDGKERAAVEHIDLMQECNQLRANAATHEKTLDDLAEARSNVAHLKSQLQASQTAQERTASELDKVKSTLANVKDGVEIAATNHAKTLSVLNTVRSALAGAESKFLAPQNAQSNMASEEPLALGKVRLESSSSLDKCGGAESHLQESRTALEYTKSGLSVAEEVFRGSSSESLGESPRSKMEPIVIDSTPEESEVGEERPLTESSQPPLSMQEMIEESLTRARRPHVRTAAGESQPHSTAQSLFGMPLESSSQLPRHHLNEARPIASGQRIPPSCPPLSPNPRVQRGPRRQFAFLPPSQLHPQGDNFSGGFVPPSFPMPQGAQIPFEPTQSPSQDRYD